MLRNQSKQQAASTGEGSAVTSAANSTVASALGSTSNLPTLGLSNKVPNKKTGYNFDTPPINSNGNTKEAAKSNRRDFYSNMADVYI